MSEENATPSRPAPRVFISYSHDSPDHKARVKAIAGQLCAHGAYGTLHCCAGLARTRTSPYLPALLTRYS